MYRWSARFPYVLCIVCIACAYEEPFAPIYPPLLPPNIEYALANPSVVGGSDCV
jgi:hypothetical protein